MSDAVVALREAETTFLRALGWTERPVKMWNKKLVTRWVDPKNGDEMDKWAAVARAKARCDFDLG